MFQYVPSTFPTVRLTFQTNCYKVIRSYTFRVTVPSKCKDVIRSFTFRLRSYTFSHTSGKIWFEKLRSHTLRATPPLNRQSAYTISYVPIRSMRPICWKAQRHNSALAHQVSRTGSITLSLSLSLCIYIYAYIDINRYVPCTHTSLYVPTPIPGAFRKILLRSDPPTFIIHSSDHRATCPQKALAITFLYVPDTFLDVAWGPFSLGFVGSRGSRTRFRILGHLTRDIAQTQPDRRFLMIAGPSLRVIRSYTFPHNPLGKFYQSCFEVIRSCTFPHSPLGKFY